MKIFTPNEKGYFSPFFRSTPALTPIALQRTWDNLKERDVEMPRSAQFGGRRMHVSRLRLLKSIATALGASEKCDINPMHLVVFNVASFILFPEPSANFGSKSKSNQYRDQFSSKMTALIQANKALEKYLGSAQGKEVLNWLPITFVLQQGSVLNAISEMDVTIQRAVVEVDGIFGQGLGESLKTLRKHMGSAAAVVELCEAIERSVQQAGYTTNSKVKERVKSRLYRR